MSNGFDIADHVTKSLGPHAFRFSAGLILRGTDGRIEVGSGVFVRIGERHFVATAAHNIAGIPDTRIGLVHHEQAHSGYGGFVRRSPDVHEGYSIDVGFLELGADLLDRCQKEFLPITRIRPYCGHVDPEGAYVLGYPAAASELEFPATVGLGGVGSAMLTRKPDDFEDVDADADIILSYSGDVYDPDTGVVGKPSPPEGLSGGGIWAIPGMVNSKVWSAEQLRLIGIQNRWRRRSEILLGTQIQHWLALIRSHYPALEEILDQTV